MGHNYAGDLEIGLAVEALSLDEAQALAAR